jgi:hypothetical protein
MTPSEGDTRAEEGAEARPAKIAQTIDALKGCQCSRTPSSTFAYVARCPWWTAATIDQRRRLYRKMRECERKVKMGRRPDFDGSQACVAGRRVRRGRPRASPALSGLSTGQGGAAPSARGELSIARSRPCSCATAVTELLRLHRANLLGRNSRLAPTPRQHLRSARQLIHNRSLSMSSISHSTDLLRFVDRMIVRRARSPRGQRAGGSGRSNRCTPFSQDTRRRAVEGRAFLRGVEKPGDQDRLPNRAPRT